MKITGQQRLTGACLVLLLLVTQNLFAQFSEQDIQRFRERFGRSRGSRSSNMNPEQSEEKKPDAPKEGEKKEEKPAEPPKDTGPKPVTRPTAPSSSPKLDEQKLTVDDKKMVAFNFEGAPWSFVLDELARVSDMNLDWQELPGDFLNLRNPRPYTLDQARDTINQHLLARGYTLLNNGLTFSVVNLEKLNPASVPRVGVEELDQRQPHDFVKVSFPLQWMLADTAVEEFKPMLSPKGKLTALKSTNRIEAVDAVINLREIRDLLAQEEGPGGQKLVTEIELKHTRATDIKEQLEVFLGLKKEAPFAMPKDQQGQQAAMQMMQMQMQMRQQQQQQQQAGAKADPDKVKEAIHLSTNARRNSILVQAPPDQLVVIRQTIQYLDVPSERPSLLANSNMMQTYRLATVDPAILISTLESVGDLAPDTRLDLDKANRAIIAYASPVDQYKIRAVVQQLDGTDRSLHVVRLRRLEADQVAGTIERLLVGEKQDSSSSRRNRYSYWGYGGSSDTEEKKTGEFRVDADIMNNRLLLWANQVEYEEVMKFLAELGEIPPKGGNPDTLRVLDIETEDDLLEQIRRAWPSLGPNQLNIQVPKKKPAEPQKQEDNSKEETVPEKKGDQPRFPEKGTTTTGLGRDLLQYATFERSGREDAQIVENPDLLAQNNGEQNNDEKTDAPEQSAEPVVEDQPQAAPSTKGDSNAPEEQEPNEAPETRDFPRRRNLEELPSAEPPPINITRGADGRLVITSQDTQALDRLEELVARLAPPRKTYQIFTLQYASALWVKYNLEDFFKEEEEDKNSGRRPYWYYYEYGSDETKDTSLRLSKRRPLKFIDDTDSNTILVQGADSEQLKTIEELIHHYDQPTQNSKMVRVTRIFQIQHSKAKIIAEAVKDVYRDLLSANDKALQQHNETKSKGRGESYYFNYGDEKSDEINQGRFKGLLSIGIDEASNNLVVSAPESLLNNVATIIEDLDKAAEPQATTFQVLQINRSSNAEEIQKKLAEMLGAGAKRQTPQQQQPQQFKGRNQNGREANNND